MDDKQKAVDIEFERPVSLSKLWRHLNVICGSLG
eukprot:COSAG04_NODE_8_length_44311_cov_99.067531_1_plen_33_part_10